MPNKAHQTNVWHQIGHQAGVLFLLYLHLFICNEGETNKKNQRKEMAETKKRQIILVYQDVRVQQK